MFDIRVTGLDQLNQVSEMLAALKRIQFKLLRNSSGEIDMEGSMREMERAVDGKLRRFSGNPLAKQGGDAAKHQFREQILKHAADSRSRLHSSGLPISEFHPFKGGFK
jgi:hypothetical protein